MKIFGKPHEIAPGVIREGRRLFIFDDVARDFDLDYDPTIPVRPVDPAEAARTQESLERIEATGLFDTDAVNDPERRDEILSKAAEVLADILKGNRQ